MKALKFSTIAAVAAFGFVLSSCDSEDEVVPEIAPAKKVEAAKPTPKPVENKADSMPELQSIQSLSAAPSSSAGASVTSDSDQPGSEGSITIQVSIQPSKRSANAILKKLNEQGIEGYLAQVENPGELEGTYYRVRVGYFKKLEQAKNFGKTKLEPLGFAWWIDNRANDAVGSPESAETTSSYSGNTSSYSNSYSNSYSSDNTSYDTIPTDSEIPSVSEPAPEPVQEPAPEETPAAVEEAPAPVETVSEPAPEPVAEPAPATSNASEDAYDDWE